MAQHVLTKARSEVAEARRLADAQQGEGKWGGKDFFWARESKRIVGGIEARDAKAR